MQTNCFSMLAPGGRKRESINHNEAQHYVSATGQERKPTSSEKVFSIRPCWSADQKT